MEQRYKIELTEEQLMLISQCVEDCHRFAVGQTELAHTVATLTSNERKEARVFLSAIDLPQYDWAGNGCADKDKRRFIAQTYGIYREILHFLHRDAEDWNVYKSGTLTCDESVPLIKVEKI